MAWTAEAAATVRAATACIVFIFCVFPRHRRASRMADYAMEQAVVSRPRLCVDKAEGGGVVITRPLKVVGSCRDGRVATTSE
jgi:hypothetical protein